MRKDNTNNYQTPYSRIQHFKDFVNKERGEKDELGEIERSYIDEPNYDLPHKFKSKYNKVWLVEITLEKTFYIEKISIIHLR